MDSIISQNYLIYGSENLIILIKNNRFGVSLSNGTEIKKIKYENAKFLGKYIMLYDNKKWNYYIFENNVLKSITTTNIECITPAYQNDVIGVFIKDKRYNLLKIDGETLSKEFDYISPDGT